MSNAASPDAIAVSRRPVRCDSGGAAISPLSWALSTSRPLSRAHTSWPTISPTAGRVQGSTPEWDRSGEPAPSRFPDGTSETAGWMKHSVLPCAISRPSSSVTLPSASPIVLRSWITRPRTVTVLPTRAGASSRSDSSEVENGVAPGSCVWSAHAIAASAGITSGPIPIVPWGAHSQRVSGIVNSAVPSPMALSRIPVSREIGGCGISPLSIARRCSGPLSPKNRGAG